jgi:hypothetical protein
MVWTNSLFLSVTDEDKEHQVIWDSKMKKINFTLKQAMKAQRGSRDIAVLFP